eukprot:snap_masked-scaffold_48-processed-gene-1.67-mRNA-1 protein AED:1.00 eAED:1.00 QI:0/-1/0/0/-1/1/1/0/598
MDVENLYFSVRQYEEICRHVTDHPCLLHFSIGELVNFTSLNRQHCLNYLKQELHARYYLETQLEEATLIVLGDGRVGKTSFIRSLCGYEFLRFQKSTPLLDFKYLINVTKSGWTPLTRQKLHAAQISQHLTRLQEIEYSEKKKGSKHLLRFEDELLDECLLDKKYFTSKRGPKFGDQVNRSEVNLRVYDFGGQQSFYTVHRIFFTNFGISIIVFNSLKTDKSDLDRIKFFVESIKKGSPFSHVFLVGTHWKKLQDKKGKEGCISVTRNIGHLMGPYGVELQLSVGKDGFFCPLENSNPKKYIEHIRKRIEDICFFCRHNNVYFKLRGPLYQLLFMNNLRREYNRIPFSDLISKGEQSGISVDEINEMLKSYSLAGLIIYIPELNNILGGSNLIILALPWLSEALSKFLIDPDLHTFAFEVSKPKFREYKKYVRSGIISDELFCDVLRSYTTEDQSYIREIARHFFILIDYPRRKKTKRQYLVANLLPEKPWNCRLDQISIPTEFNFFIRTQFDMFAEDFGHLALFYLEESNVNAQLETPILLKKFARILFPDLGSVSLVFVSNRAIGVKAHDGLSEQNLTALTDIVMPKYIKKRKVFK